VVFFIAGIFKNLLYGIAITDYHWRPHIRTIAGLFSWPEDA
jgi:hypothetical protein